MLCREANSKDANYKLLEENRERLEGFKLENGRKVTTAFLPMPEPLYYRGQRLPASYANFLITNSSVLVPTFNDPADRIALGTLAELFPKRKVVGIHAVDLVWGLGTLHCLSQQQPADDSVAEALRRRDELIADPSIGISMDELRTGISERFDL